MIEVGFFAGHNVGIFGLARSGLSAAHALTRGRARVFAWDDSHAARDGADAKGIPLVAWERWPWERLKAVILSPGIPLTSPAPHAIVRRAQAAGVEVIGDVELFARAIRPSGANKGAAPVIAVTGTNGKSTTTALIGHILTAAGFDAQVGGNIGEPVLDLGAPRDNTVYVLEISSYQIDLAPGLVPDIAVLTNLSPDHIDRHGTMANYVAVKTALLARSAPGGVAANQTPGGVAANQTPGGVAADQTPGGVAADSTNDTQGVPGGVAADSTNRRSAPGGHVVIGIDDSYSAAICTRLAARGVVKVVAVSVGKVLGRGIFVIDGHLFDAWDRSPAELGDLGKAAHLPGAHNWQNAALAYGAVRSLVHNPRVIIDAIMDFPGLAHRLEEVGRVGKVRFVNDSKATNADATACALVCYPDIFWIAGGRAKEGGIADLAPYFPRLRRAYLIGEAAQSFGRTLAGKVEAVQCGTLDRALAACLSDAAASTVPDPVVLLSPACDSRDQFRDFEHRGDVFRAAVKAMMDAPGGVAADSTNGTQGAPKGPKEARA